MQSNARIVRWIKDSPWKVPRALSQFSYRRIIDSWSSPNEDHSFHRRTHSRRIAGWLPQPQDSFTWCFWWNNCMLLRRWLLQVRFSRSWCRRWRKGLLRQQLCKQLLNDRGSRPWCCRQRKSILCQQLLQVSRPRRCQQRKDFKTSWLPIFRCQWLRQVQLTAQISLERRDRSVISRSGFARWAIIAS